MVGEQQGNGMGTATAWERHGMCESTVRLSHIFQEIQQKIIYESRLEGGSLSDIRTSRLYPQK
jgi:hypothetical protein